MKKIFTLLIQPKIYVLTFVLSVSILAGCKKDIADYDTLTNTVPVNYLDQIKFNSQRNILVFENINTLKQIIADNSATGGNAVAAMNARFPAFKSMMNIYTEFDKKEADLLVNLDDSGLLSQTIDWTKYLKMSDIGKTYTDMILVKQFPDNLDYYYEMNINQKHYANYVNSGGLLAVNDTIYQFSENYVKLITDGDYAKIPLLKTTSTTNAGSGIIVLDSKKFMLGWPKVGPMFPHACTNVWEDTKETSSGSGIDQRRIGMSVRFEQNPVSVDENETKFSFTFTYGKKKVSCIKYGKLTHVWVDAAIKRCVISNAEFTSSRPPASSIYHSPSGFNSMLPAAHQNPFKLAHKAIELTLCDPFVHFIDYSSAFDPCYVMTSGKYQIDASFGDFGILTASVTYNW